jgi:hypothetical protein
MVIKTKDESLGGKFVESRFARLGEDFVTKSSGAAAVIAPAEVFFQPDIGADEEVAAAHLFDLQLGDPEFAVVPADRGNRVSPPIHWTQDKVN